MHFTERLPHETGRDYALRTIKNNIIRLELAPGSKLSENELAQAIGLSRTPVREALIELSKAKIVEIWPQRKSTIALVDYDLVEESCFMRETLEDAVAERCCQLDVSYHLIWFQENLKLQKFYLENRSAVKLWELDDAFHRKLFTIANLTHVYSLMDSMTVHFDRVRAMSLSTVKDLKTVEDHQKIVQAIMDHDAPTARQFMHAHLTRYQIDKETIRNAYPQYFKD